MWKHGLMAIPILFNIYHIVGHCYCNTLSFSSICYESDKISFILCTVPHSSDCQSLSQAVLVPCLEYHSNWMSSSLLLLCNAPLTLWPLWFFWNKSQATLSLSYKPFSDFPLLLGWSLSFLTWLVRMSVIKQKYRLCVDISMWPKMRVTEWTQDGVRSNFSCIMGALCGAFLSSPSFIFFFSGLFIGSLTFSATKCTVLEFSLKTYESFCMLRRHGQVLPLNLVSHLKTSLRLHSEGWTVPSSQCGSVRSIK